MRMKDTAIEIKVGALVIAGIALLVAFVVILGDFSFDEGQIVYIDFDHAGGLKQGADVMISGIKAGKVKKLEFHGGKYDEEAGREVMVRAAVQIDTEMTADIRQNSEFFITTQGVLGEKYVEIITPNLDKPVVAPGAKMRGIDPPRMEILLARAAEVLESVSELLGRDDIPIADLIRNTNSLVKHSDELIVENSSAVHSILANVEVASRDLTNITAAANVGLGDGSDIRATLQNARSLTGKLDRNFDPIADKANATLENTEALTGDLRGMIASKRPAVEGTIDNVYATSADAKAAAGNVKTLTDDIGDGKGTVGGLMKDEEIYDDLKEMLRELKRRPWKIIWKE
jgi:phospholipid/cholesterol/gamma-HCH transport system substrate-binding protein